MRAAAAVATLAVTRPAVVVLATVSPVVMVRAMRRSLVLVLAPVARRSAVILRRGWRRRALPTTLPIFGAVSLRWQRRLRGCAAIATRCLRSAGGSTSDRCSCVGLPVGARIVRTGHATLTLTLELLLVLQLLKLRSLLLQLLLRLFALAHRLGGSRDGRCAFGLELHRLLIGCSHGALGLDLLGL